MVYALLCAVACAANPNPCAAEDCARSELYDAPAGLMRFDEAVKRCLADDLNHDGFKDLLLVFNSGNNIGAWFGNGDGTFREMPSSQRSIYPQDIRGFGDLNGDGEVDLVASYANSWKVGVYYGMGDGTGAFGDLLEIANQTRIASAQVTDLNGDGAADIVAAGRDGISGKQGLVVLLANGEGGFETPVVTPSPNDFTMDHADAWRLALGDLNGDGFGDVAVRFIVNSGTPDIVEVFLGQGDGTFVGVGETHSAHLNAQMLDYDVLVMDADADGYADIVLPDEGTTSVLFGDGTGHFPDRHELEHGIQNIDAQAVDIDGDGNEELLLASYVAVGVYRFAPDRTHDRVFYPTPGALFVDDFTDDGVPDLLSVEYVGSFSNSAWVTTIRGRGDGTFEQASTTEPRSYYFYDHAFGELTGDTKPDIIRHWADDRFAVMPGSGDGAFGDPIVGGSGLSRTFGFVIADFDGDGLADLARGNTDWGDISVLYGSGDGHFSQMEAQGFSDGNCRNARFSDLNSDGSPDMIVASGGYRVWYSDGVRPSPDTEAHFLDGQYGGEGTLVDVNGDGALDIIDRISRDNHDLYVVLCDGEGGFEDPIPTGLQSGHSSSRIFTCDIVGTEHIDLLRYDYATRTLSIHEGAGNGTFSLCCSIDLGVETGRLESVVPGDVDGDGIKDLFVGYANRSLIKVAQGLDGVSFALSQSIETPESTVDVRAGDINGDGRSDLLVWSGDSYGGAFEVYLSDEDGELTLHQQLADFGGYRFEFVDVTGDGRRDVILPDSGSHSVCVYEADGADSFANPVRYQVGEEPVAVEAVDLDNDGVLELVSMNEEGRSFTYLVRDATGGFQGERRYPCLDVSDAGLASGDFNGDGAPDLAGPKTLLLNDGTGKQYQVIDIEAYGNMAFCDLDQDGFDDLVSCRPDFHVLFGSESGVSDPVRVTSLKLSDMDFGDLNGDGLPDIVAIKNGLRGIATNLSGRSMDWQYSSVPDYGTFVRIADFDADGYQDLLTQNTQTLAPVIIFGDESMSMTEAVWLPPGEYVDVEVTHFDPGGGPDILFFGEINTVLRSRCANLVPCNPADNARPYQCLSIDDVLGFLTGFAGEDLDASDLAPPEGQLDIDDVLAFLHFFQLGCE